MKQKAKRLNKLLIAVVTALIIVLLVSPTNAKKASIVQSGEYGEIDWSGGVITAQGTELGAARQNLWGIIKGLRVDNEYLADELIARSAGLKKQLQQLIEQAAPVEKKDLTSGQAGIRLSLSLTGPFVEALLSVQQINSADRHPARFGPPGGNPGPSGPSFILGTTGLVVDARGLEVVPALYPRILSEDGRVIYDLSKANRSYTVKHGLIKYMPDVAIAEKSKRVDNNPIVVKVLKIAPDTATDLIINSKDADWVSRAGMRYDFLYKCRVIIVIDQAQKAVHDKE